MIYSHTIDNAFENAIGKDGAEQALYKQYLGKTQGAIASLKARKEYGSLPILGIGERQDDLADIYAAAKRISAFRHFVVVGMGGSSYGGKALCALAHNTFAPATATSIHFLDNIDPLTSDRALLCLDFKTTMFALVSKSGDTAETLSQGLILIHEAISRLGKDAVAEHFIVVTEPKDSALTRLAKKHAISMLAHDPKIGGRFSALSNVGLLPAKVAGLDIRAIRKGAAYVAAQVFGSAESEPAKGAALQMALLERGRSLAVMMPYCDRLDALNVWFCQLWAESLGKGGKGTTPLRSLGACDQHSQLQLYLDGPRDKFISLIFLDQVCKGASLPEIDDPALSYLKGRTLGDLMDAEQRATAQTLTRNCCPVRIFGLKQLDEESLGALMMHFMLETMIMGELLEVNTFDQPAVEEGKILAREFLATGKKSLS